MPRRLLFLTAASALLSLALTAPASALTLPLSGWNAADSSQQTWTDAASACTLREDRSTQPYSSFVDPDAALAFAGRLQTALQAQNVGGQKLSAVLTQPVERAGRWTVLAAYRFTQGGVDYDVTQLYLSDDGHLRTITGSSEKGEIRGCVTQMREFVRYLAN